MRKLFRKVAKAISKLLDAIVNPYYAIKDYLRFREAVIMADDAHAKDSDRYYVMPTMNGKLMVMDRKNFRILKQKGYIAKNASMQSAIRECFYYTPKIGEVEPMTASIGKAKYEEYKQWCKAMRIMNHFTR